MFRTTERYSAAHHNSASLVEEYIALVEGRETTYPSPANLELAFRAAVQLRNQYAAAAAKHWVRRAGRLIRELMSPVPTRSAAFATVA